MTLTLDILGCAIPYVVTQFIVKEWQRLAEPAQKLYSKHVSGALLVRNFGEKSDCRATYSAQVLRWSAKSVSEMKRECLNFESL